MIRKCHGPGQARSARIDLAAPHSRELAPPAQTVGFEMSEILQFENITKRDDFFSAFFVRTEMSRIVIFWYAKKSRIVFFSSLGTALINPKYRDISEFYICLVLLSDIHIVGIVRVGRPRSEAPCTAY